LQLATTFLLIADSICWVTRTLLNELKVRSKRNLKSRTLGSEDRKTEISLKIFCQRGSTC